MYTQIVSQPSLFQMVACRPFGCWVDVCSHGSRMGVPMGAGWVFPWKPSETQPIEIFVARLYHVAISACGQGHGAKSASVPMPKGRSKWRSLIKLDITLDAPSLVLLIAQGVVRIVDAGEPAMPAQGKSATIRWSIFVDGSEATDRMLQTGRSFSTSQFWVPMIALTQITIPTGAHVVELRMRTEVPASVSAKPKAEMLTPLLMTLGK